MEYRRLGGSGLKVSAIGLGAVTFGRNVDETGAAAIVHRALDAGINVIDTANIYNAGKSEEYIGQALKGRRHEAVIATKVSGKMGDGPNDSGSSRLHIMREVEKSLRRLSTDYIDLYQLHFTDGTTPIAESLRALDDLVHQGKVRYIGCSNFMAWQVCEAVWVSRASRLTSFVSVQPQYSMISRRVEAELVPFCREYGVGILPYNPLSKGFLTGRYRRGQPPPVGTQLERDDRGLLTDAKFNVLDGLERFAQERGHSVLELAFAWLLSNPAVSSVIAGVSSAEQVLENARCFGWRLSEQDLSEIDLLLGS